MCLAVCVDEPLEGGGKQPSFILAKQNHANNTRADKTSNYYPTAFQKSPFSAQQDSLKSTISNLVRNNDAEIDSMMQKMRESLMDNKPPGLDHQSTGLTSQLSNTTPKMIKDSG